ncbi:hypothetical protein [Candidatus Clostridium radicumherbarum]|uniref:Uncharacterized protein n=1 Tax=Candidatus Clostridium radicumherbarum TaxID=3381662 RepID=A0ABW8TPV5_9CLOT
MKINKTELHKHKRENKYINNTKKKKQRPSFKNIIQAIRNEKVQNCYNKHLAIFLIADYFYHQMNGII